ncbi:MAG: hypothetical protein WA793_05170, partial [Sphingorhabdus sp.]
LIDDGALAMIQNARPMTPTSQPWSQPSMRGEGKVIAVSNGIAHRERRVLKVVFPAFVDQRGFLHEPRVVHAVADQGGWMQLAAPADLPALAQSPSPRSETSTDGTRRPQALADPRAGETGAASLGAGQVSGPLNHADALPDPAKVAAARELGKYRLPTTPSEIKAAVEAQFTPQGGKTEASQLPLPLEPRADRKSHAEESPSIEPPEPGAATPTAANGVVNAPAVFPGRVEP